MCALATIYYFGFLLFNGIRFRDIFKRHAYKHTNAKRVIGTIGLGFALSAIIIGVLFKLQFWTGAEFNLLIGFIFTGIIFLIAFPFYLRNKTAFYNRIIKRILIISSVGLMAYVVPTDSLVDLYHGHNPEYAELYKKRLKDRDNVELQEELYKMEREIEEAKRQNDN
ncbi:MAG: hypothetical protein HKN75_02955 [Bacteroidia bacterium]|nr:hypothetical protein [Bacteroidia bacterium]